MGLAPVVHRPEVCETALGDESPRQLVERLAETKGRHVARRLGTTDELTIVLAADTAVVLDAQPLGKPRDAAHAVEMLRSLRGREHEVLTGVFLLRTDDGRSICESERTRVVFRGYDEQTILDYVQTAEPLDKAGAYGIQGGGSQLVLRVDGSWTNVVGLPCERIGGWLERIGITLDRLTRRSGISRSPG
jgi:septum formation protein